MKHGQQNVKFLFSVLENGNIQYHTRMSHPTPTPNLLPPKGKKLQQPYQKSSPKCPSYNALTGYSFSKLNKNLVKIIKNEKPIGKI